MNMADLIPFLNKQVQFEFDGKEWSNCTLTSLGFEHAFFDYYGIQEELSFADITNMRELPRQPQRPIEGEERQLPAEFNGTLGSIQWPN